jgi:hypothetical protein
MGSTAIAAAITPSLLIACAIAAAVIISAIAPTLKTLSKPTRSNTLEVAQSTEELHKGAVHVSGRQQLTHVQHCAHHIHQAAAADEFTVAKSVLSICFSVLNTDLLV